MTKKNRDKLVKKIGKILYGIVFVCLLIIAGIVALSSLKIPGNYKIFTVQSGSMEPSIMTGSVVIIKPFDSYQKGDVITVREPGNPKSTLTHRIFEVKESSDSASYITKGDANNAPDSEQRPKANVLGKVIFTVPFAGYPIGFAKTRNGLIILVIIPATLIIYSELVSIKNEAIKLIKKRKKRLTPKQKLEVKLVKDEIKTENKIKRLFNKILSKFLILLIILGVGSVASTNALLSDREKSSGNSFAAGSVDFSLDGSGFDIPGIKTGDLHSKTVKVIKDGSLDFQYSVKATKTGGDDVLCNTLQIEAKLDGISQYNGSLTGFNLNPAATISGGDDAWEFIVRLDSTDPSLQTKSCNFNLSVKGWQIGSDGTWGLMDTESLTNNVTVADTIKPVSIITIPTNPGSNNTVLTLFWNGDVSGTAADTGSGINRVELSIHDLVADQYWNGISWVFGSESSVRVPATGTSNWTYNLPGPHIGTFSITSHAIDNAGNVENSYTITIINNSEPEETKLNFYLREDKNAVGFKVSGDLSGYKSLDYLITYGSNQSTQGIMGTKVISGVSEITEEDLLLGSCSSGGTCTYNTGITNINLKVTLHGTSDKILEEKISL